MLWWWWWGGGVVLEGGMSEAVSLVESEEKGKGMDWSGGVYVGGG